MGTEERFKNHRGYIKITAITFFTGGDNMVRCTNCWFMFYHDEINYGGMDCNHGNAMPENGAPEIIDDEEHNCPYFEPKD